MTTGVLRVLKGVDEQKRNSVHYQSVIRRTNAVIAAQIFFFLNSIYAVILSSLSYNFTTRDEQMGATMCTANPFQPAFHLLFFLLLVFLILFLIFIMPSRWPSDRQVPRDHLRYPLLHGNTEILWSHARELLGRPPRPRREEGQCPNSDCITHEFGKRGEPS